MSSIQLIRTASANQKKALIVLKHYRTIRAFLLVFFWGREGAEHESSKEFIKV